MAGLAAAWRLSEPGWEERFSRITVYQRGWRLGGKGASSRGSNGRIEEHGLHIWLGYYENSFRMVRQVYAELDRAADRSGDTHSDLDRCLPTRDRRRIRGLRRDTLEALGRHLPPERRAPR